MLNFIAKYTGKIVGHTVNAIDTTWEDTKSMSKTFTQAYKETTTPPPSKSDAIIAELKKQKEEGTLKNNPIVEQNYDAVVESLEGEKNAS